MDYREKLEVICKTCAQTVPLNKAQDHNCPGLTQAGSGIHPAPVEFSQEELAADPILRYFHYSHLPPALQPTSRGFCGLAQWIVSNVPRNPERTVALRKLLEGKDAAVRANTNLPIIKPAILQDEGDLHGAELGEPVEIGGYDIGKDRLRFEG